MRCWLFLWHHHEVDICASEWNVTNCLWREVSHLGVGVGLKPCLSGCHRVVFKHELLEYLTHLNDYVNFRIWRPFVTYTGLDILQPKQWAFWTWVAFILLHLDTNLLTLKCKTFGYWYMYQLKYIHCLQWYNQTLLKKIEYIGGRIFLQFNNKTFSSKLIKSVHWSKKKNQ